MHLGPHARLHLVGALLMVIAACSGQARPRSAPETGLSTEIDLADWGLSQASDVSMVRVTIPRVAKPTLGIGEVRAGVRPPATVPDRPGVPLRFVDGLAIVAPMSSGGFNHLGGSFAPFAKAPSKSKVDIASQAARFRYRRSRDGFAGFWIHLFDDRAARRDRRYVDASAATQLVFEIRGARGGERVGLQIADGRWEGKGDSLRVGPISSFIKSGKIRRRWQRVVVPMEELGRVNLEQLASVVFVADRRGRGTVFIRNIAFSTRPDVALTHRQSRRSARRKMRIAMWVWKASEVAASRDEISTLVDFCRERGVTDLFLQVPAPAAPDGLRVGSDLEVLRPLVRALAVAGVRSEALDGAPSLALAQNHRINQATVAAVIEFNKRGPKRERFVGVRLDNEPYLLPGFRGPRQASISRQYLDALEKATTLAHTGGLTMGADIPFWFDTYNAYDELGAGLEGRPLSELVLERVDNISIMDYRTEAYGADGVIAHAWHEVEFAALAGKQVYVALETENLPDESHEEFRGPMKPGEAALVLIPGRAGKLRLVHFEANESAEAAALVEKHRGARALGRVKAMRLDAGKLSFVRSEVSDLDEVIEQSWRDLSRSPALIGVAIHSYEAYRRWQATPAP